jgi:hypothetical protein
MTPCSTPYTLHSIALQYNTSSQNSNPQRYFKGTVSQDFLIQVFSMNHSPRVPEINIKVISNFFENPLRYLQVKGHHLYQ